MSSVFGVFFRARMCDGPPTTTFIAQGYEASVCSDGVEHEVLGGGLLSSEAIGDAGFDAGAVSAFAWGMSLERLVMLKLGLDDIHKLWRPPYVPATA